jgi:hypothetical protein
MKVFRYDLGEGESTVEMVAGAQVLGAHFASRGLVIHALVNENNDATEERTFLATGNGEEFPETLDSLGVEGAAAFYRGTAKVPGGPTAHVFELTKVLSEA